MNINDHGDKVVLGYDTARAPNNLTLLKLSEIADWRIQNEYEEPGIWFEGTYICENGKTILDHEAAYRPVCDTCQNKYPEEEMKQDDDNYEWICDNCLKKEGD